MTDKIECLELPKDATELIWVGNRLDSFHFYTEKIYLTTDSIYYFCHEGKYGLEEVKILAPEEVKEWIAKVRNSYEFYNEKQLNQVEQKLNG